MSYIIGQVTYHEIIYKMLSKLWATNMRNEFNGLKYQYGLCIFLVNVALLWTKIYSESMRSYDLSLPTWREWATPRTFGHMLFALPINVFLHEPEVTDKNLF